MIFSARLRSDPMESPEEAAGVYSSGSDDSCRHATTTIFTKRKRTKRLRALSSSSNGLLVGTTAEEEDTAHCLILLAMGRPAHHEDEKGERVVKFSSRKFVETAAGASAGFYVYECRSCSKRFSSFQALGGHRASHRKPKPAANGAVDDGRIFHPEPASAAADQAGRARVHECAICGAEFASGQALGGHMRRHRPVGPTAPAPESPGLIAEKERKEVVLALDLNLPAPAEDPMAAAFAFADRRPLQALVGCHY